MFGQVTATLREALSLTVGLPFASWRHLTRELEIRRDEGSCDWPIEGFPTADRTPVGDPTSLQPAAAGRGPVFHRRYRASVEEPVLVAEELMSVVISDPNVACPPEMASFERRERVCVPLAVGEDLRVRLPGPWNGPVRVVELTPTSFRLATLVGHMEAGEIEFRARDDRDGLLVEIESWARSGDRAFDLLYDRVGIARELQLEMWASFVERMAQLSGGRILGGIDVRTRRCEAHPMG